MPASVAKSQQLLTIVEVFSKRKGHRGAFDDCDMDFIVYIWKKPESTSARLRFPFKLEDSLPLYIQTYPELNKSS